MHSIDNIKSVVHEHPEVFASRKTERTKRQLPSDCHRTTLIGRAGIIALVEKKSWMHMYARIDHKLRELKPSEEQVL
jgi:hypothetical protein